LNIHASAQIWSSPEADWSQYDAVIVRSCWDYHLRVDEFREWIDHLQRQGIRVFNSPGLIRWNIDKRYLRELPVSIPHSIWLASDEDIELSDVCRTNSWPAAVVKPLISASAYKTQRSGAGAVCGPALIQEYLPEIESAGEWSLMYFAGTFSHAVRKRAAAGDFRVQAEFGGTAELASPPRNLLLAAERAMETLASQPLFARVDLVERGASALLMELELIEPELFLHLSPGASERLALAVRDALSRGSR
jgi:glutathione synthase/RimK-type ligase-like ATP-grasp enzyme